MTNDEFEALKMELEVQSIKNRLEKEKMEMKPSWISVIFNQSTKSISFIVAIVSMLAGVWGLVIPARQFFKDKQQEKQYELSATMVDLADQLKSESAEEQRRAVLLLSYYDLNSMPILLYQLENFDNKIEATMVDHVIKTISIIYMRNQSQVTSEIIYYFSNLFKQTDTEGKWNPAKYNSLKNFGRLINNITFRDRDKARILKIVKEMQEVIERDTKLKENLMKTFYDQLTAF